MVLFTIFRGNQTETKKYAFVLPNNINLIRNNFNICWLKCYLFCAYILGYAGVIICHITESKNEHIISTVIYFIIFRTEIDIVVPDTIIRFPSLYSVSSHDNTPQVFLQDNYAVVHAYIE